MKLAGSFVKGRGVNFCRGCLGETLFSALDLGELPIANELLLSSESIPERFPLHLRVCSACGLGQVPDVVTPERIFRDYRYLSSISSTFLKHAAHFVSQQIASRSFLSSDWVLEIASNDGYLLKNFLPSGVKAIGIEPAENVAEISRSLGIDTVSDFFSNELATDLLNQYGPPKLIIANNVMAHVPDLVDFVKGLATLVGPDTEISIENPSMASILTDLQFDTIYHEHYSYLSATSVEAISRMNGLELFRVEQLPIHGGSNRYWLRKLKTVNNSEASVENTKNYEISIGLFEVDSWRNLSLNVRRILKNFENWLVGDGSNERKIYGYGAAAKASTLLNSIDQDASNFLLGVADLSIEKQHRFMPPLGIEIISPEKLASLYPTDIVIFPWNIRSEIASQLRSQLGNSVRMWCAIPDLHEVI
jgi:hypothetical protein